LAVDIPDFLIMAAELETLASKLYESLAGLSPGTDLARQLKSLANDEVNHANILYMGKKYYEEMPDVFSGKKIDDDELWAGIEEAKRFQALIILGFSLPAGLKKMLHFERRFEKIHLDASVKVTEDSLKKLFIDLMKGDQSHLAILKNLIESLGMDAK
jgi:rubrerythrin